MASLDPVESMEEDFTGFDEEPLGVVVNPSGATILDVENTSRMEDANETDSDSGNLVIAEPEKKQAVKNAEKSPRKRKPKVEDVTPTRAPSSRVRGQGLAYLLAMEKGGSKKQLAKAQAQVDAQDIPAALLSPEYRPQVPSFPEVEPTASEFLEPEKKKSGAKEKGIKESARLAAREKENTDGVQKEIEAVPVKETTPNVMQATNSPVPPVVKAAKGGARKSFAAVNISSPLLKEPFKEGWRREVVYRAIVDPGMKTLCDVYYYTPDGKKLRSGREVSDYLDKSDGPLSSENFTFFKEPIGMEPHQEILRYAKTHRRDDGAGEKLITKKEKALKAREEELRRNLQELGEDVAAITAQTPAQDAEASPGSVGTVGGAVPPTTESNSPGQQKRKRGGKVEKQLKIKLWGKGLRSKENAEPLRKEDTTEGEEETGTIPSTLAEKISPSHTVPEDISHMFTPHVSGSITASKGANKPVVRGQKGPSTPTSSAPIAIGATGSPSAAQHLVLINGKRFISVGPNPEVQTRHSPGNQSQDESSAATAIHKRALSSPGVNPPRHSPKRIKLSVGSPPPSAQYLSAVKTGCFGLFSTEQFNNFVSHAYHGLLHVFRYLTVQELMAAAGVCKLWRDLALHHSHWRLVRLKNSRIYDWSLFASHLRRAGTQHLDMRKMLFVTSPEETWVNLERAASNLSEILRIELCKCPAEVLNSIATHCLRLKLIDAQFISSPTIRLDSLHNLKQLEVLKIRSVSGMNLEGGLEAFSQLKELKSLNLTTLSNLNSSELIHLVDLPHLESLEIGDCANWSEATDYEALGQLLHLRHLRLEQGPLSCILQHLQASLSGMADLQHVELVNFTMDAPMETIKVSGLKRLLITPRYSNETLHSTVRHLFDCVVSMQHLQQLNWVVTEEILNSLDDGKLPLRTTEEVPGEEEVEKVTLDELQDLLRQRLPQTNVHLLRLPESAAHRYSLSVDQED